MGGGAWRWLLIGMLVVLMVAWWFGCFGRQPGNVLVFAPLPGNPSGNVTRTKLPGSALRPFTPTVQKPAPPPDAPRETLDPIINDWIAMGRASVRERFVVLWRDPVPIPMFPELDLSLPLSGAPVNDTAFSRARRAMLRIQDLRRPLFAADTAGLAVGYRARGIESYWIVQAMLMEMPVDRAVALASRPGVVYVTPDSTGALPPQGTCTSAGYSSGPFVADAREILGTDVYRDAGYPAAWLSLLDTGVRVDHDLLTGDALELVGDCVDGAEECRGGDPSDVNAEGHGTCSAAILVGNDSWGEPSRGTTDLKLHCYRVYESYGASGQLRTSATLEGFQQGIAQLDRVIVAEMQSKTTPHGPIAAAADHAFLTGAVVVAANGNNGAGGLVAPANARRALGVGAYVLSTGDTDMSQSRGGTGDGRVKPDLQAPSYAWTASNEATNTCKQFGQTSGGTPFAAAAAALARGWLKQAIGGDAIDPGQVMAMLIASTDGGTSTPDPLRGAGKLMLPTGGWAWFGKVTIEGTDKAWNVPIDLDGLEAKQLDAAIWWPESEASTKSKDNDLDLYLLDPDGSTVDEGVNADGVFERVSSSVTGSQRKQWTLRIHGFDLDHPAQEVYYTVVARRASSGSEPPIPR